MNAEYQKIIDFMRESGQRLQQRAGKITDIGVAKANLTEEDFRIERGFSEIIKGFGPGHTLYAEEENDLFQKSDNVWIVDPISSTESFIRGRPHYAIVISHYLKGRARFAAVYDPSVDELFTAETGKGAFINGKKIHIKDGRKPKMILPYWPSLAPRKMVKKIEQSLGDFTVLKTRYSMAIVYCNIACGRVQGVISFTVDSFPEFAGALIIKEAGGVFTNLEGSEALKPEDRVFIGGTPAVYKELHKIVKGLF